MQGSEFYGIHNTLLRHAGLPRVGAFPYAVQHGWQHAATSFEAESKPLEIWAWSERSRQGMGAFYPLERIRVIGSPYLYLENRDGEPEPAPRGSLYVLPHSSHFARIGFSHDDLRDLLAQIRATDGSCDVLAYYLDVTDTLCASLRSTRSRVLSNGGLWSGDFMHAFRRNIRRYERVYFSNFGSAVLFARYEQRQTQYVDLSSRVVSSSNAHVDRLGAEDTYDPTGAGVDTDAELGVDRRIAPEEMRELILQGLRRGSARKLAAKAYLNLRHRLRDYRTHVRPCLALAATHNATIDPKDA